MRCVITIGYQSFLLPDETGISTILKVLSKALPCDRVYGLHRGGEITVDPDNPVEISSLMIPDTVPIKTKAGDDVEIGKKPRQKTTIKALPPHTLRLTR